MRDRKIHQRLHKSLDRKPVKYVYILQSVNTPLQRVEAYVAFTDERKAMEFEKYLKTGASSRRKGKSSFEFIKGIETEQ